MFGVKHVSVCATDRCSYVTARTADRKSRHGEKLRSVCLAPGRDESSLSWFFPYISWRLPRADKNAFYTCKSSRSRWRASKERRAVSLGSAPFPSGSGVPFSGFRFQTAAKRLKRLVDHSLSTSWKVKQMLLVYISYVNIICKVIRRYEGSLLGTKVRNKVSSFVFWIALGCDTGVTLFYR